MLSIVEPRIQPQGWACVARLGGVGDNLIASSVFPLLRAKYGRLEVISRAPHAVVYENNPYIDKLTVLPEDEAPEDLLTMQRMWRKRAAEYAFFGHLSHTCEASLAFMEGQTQFHWPIEGRRKVAAHSYLGFVHDVCGLPHQFDPRYFPTDDELRRAHETREKYAAGKPVVAWCISGSRIDKIHPFAHFAIARIIAELGASVMIFGAPGKDFEIAKQIEAQVIQQNGRVDGLLTAITDKAVGADWPLRRNLAQIRTCDVLVSPDTGPAWSVAMEDIPKVMLLSHASALNITHGWRNTVTLHADPVRVPCWPCHRLHDSFETCTKATGIEAAACMADISAQAIIDAVRDALTRKEAPTDGEHFGLLSESVAGLHEHRSDGDPPDRLGAGAVHSFADALNLR